MAAGNSENDPLSPEQLARMLDFELQQKRAAWEQNRQRLTLLRAASFMFLMLVIAGGMAVWWFLASSKINDARTNRSPAANAAPAPTATAR